MKVNIYCLNGNDLAIQNHYREKEYRDDIVIEINNLFYEVYFFVEGTMKYEMTKDGFFSMPGLIILDEITFEKVCRSVNMLIDLMYFERFIGFENGPMIDRFSYHWYLKMEPGYKSERISIYKLRE